MPRYVSNGKTYNIPDDKVDAFLQSRTDAKPLDAGAPIMTSIGIGTPKTAPSTPRESNIQIAPVPLPEENMPARAYTPETGGIATFSDGSGYLPAMKSPTVGQIDTRLSIENQYKQKPLAQTMRESADALPEVQDARRNAEFEGALQRYMDSGAYTAAPDADRSLRGLPYEAVEWLNNNKKEQRSTTSVPSTTGGGSFTTVSMENTPEQMDAVRSFLQNTPEGQAYVSRRKEIEDQLDNQISELEARIEADKANKPKVQVPMSAGSGSTYGGYSTPTISELPENHQDISGATAQLRELKKLREAVEDGDRSAIAQFGREMGRRAPEGLLNIATLGIAKPLEGGMTAATLRDTDNELSREASGLLGQYEALHANDRSIAQDIARGSYDSAAFMAQFLATGGIGSALTKGAATAIANRLGGTVAAKAIGKLGEVGGKALVQAAISPSTLAGAYEMNMRDPGSFLNDYAQMFKQNFVEYASEGIGSVVPGARAMGGAKTKFGRILGKVSERTGIQGLGTEYLEEQFATAGHIAADDGQAKWEDFVDVRNQLVTLGSVALMQMPNQIVTAGGYAAGKARNIQATRSIRKGYDNNVNNMASLFGENVGEVTSLVNEKVDADPNAIFSLADAAAMDDTMTDAQKDAIVKYAYARAAYSGLENAKAEEIEAATQAVPTLVQENVNPQMGAMVSATMAGSETPVQIVGGNIVQREDGTIDAENSDSEIFYVDADGKRQVAPISMVETIAENIPADQATVQLTATLTAPIIARQENDEVREYAAGDPVRIQVGGQEMVGEITGTTPSGNYTFAATDGNMLEIEPRQIVNEDNLVGVENGARVSYIKDGQRMEGVVATSPELYLQGVVGFDNGDVIPIADIQGPTQAEAVVPNEIQAVAGEVPTTDADALPDMAQPDVQAVEAPVVEQGPSIETIAANAPKQADGNVDFDALLQERPEDAVVLLDNLLRPEDTTAELQGTADAIQSRIDSETKKLAKATTLNDRVRIKQSIAGLAANKARFDNIISARVQPPSVAAETPITETTETQAEQPELVAQAESVETPTAERVLPFSDRLRATTPLASGNLRARILYGIANGEFKFRWSDLSGTQGLAAELGLSNSESERRARIGILSNEGYTPETLAEALRDDTMLANADVLDALEVRDEIIDVLQSVSSRRQALDALEAMADDGNSLADMSEDDIAAYEAEQIRQRQAYQDEVYLQLAEESIDNLLNLADERSMTVEQLNDINTVTDLVEQLIILENGTDILTGTEGGGTEADIEVGSSGDGLSATESAVGERDRPDETGGDRTANRDSAQDNGNLTEGEQGVVEETATDDRSPIQSQSVTGSQSIFKPIGKRKFNRLVKRLTQTGLAREIVTNKASYDEQLSSVRRTMRNTNGDIYGFVTLDGTIYLDSSRMNANTPIHEFGHLWNTLIQESAPDLWRQGATLIRNSEYWQRVNDNPAYMNLPYEQKADEALAMAIGDKGESAVNDGNILSYAGIKDWLYRAWDWIKGTLGIARDVNIEDSTLDAFTDMAVGELLSGRNLRSSIEIGTFANDNTSDNDTETETGVDNDRAVGAGAFRGLLGEPSTREGIYRTVIAADAAAGEVTDRTPEQIEELESRGINPYFDIQKFRQAIEDTADANGVWLDQSFMDDKVLVHDHIGNGTSENDIYLNSDGKTLTKLNNLYLVGGTARDINFEHLIDRISSHNELFPDVAYTVRGFTYDQNDHPALVLEQDYVEAGRNATQEDINEFLTNNGFTFDDTQSLPVWTNGKYNIYDVRPANVLVDMAGNLRFIDTIPNSMAYLNGETVAPAEEVSPPAFSAQEISEMEQIKARTIEDGTFMKAPNGEPTNLTERQWLQVRTTNFKNWFGDWENNPETASKVIDENGEPMVVYHGTTTTDGFTTFDKERTNYGGTSIGFSFFTNKRSAYPDSASDYADFGNGRIYDVFLNIKNPLRYNSQGSYNTSSFFDKNHTYIRRDYRNGNNDGIIVANKDKNSDSGILYAIDNPTQIKSATDNTGEFNPDNADIRFQSIGQVADAVGSTMAEDMREELDGRLNNFAFRFREAWEDRHLAVKKFLDLLRSKGVTIAEYNDYYKQATALGGKNDAQLEAYGKRYQQPLNEVLGALENMGFSFREIENYAILKHGLERNAWMSDHAEGRAREDYSGISTVEAEVGMTAQEYIDQFEQRAGQKNVDNLWNRVKAATSFALKKQLDGGLISRELYDDLLARYQYYIPLRGHDATTAADKYDYDFNMGTYFVSPLKRAKGRISRSESPFAYIYNMAQSAIQSANSNILNQSILRLAQKDKTGLMSVSKAWYVQSGQNEDGTPTYEVQAPVYSENPEQYQENIEQFEARMKELEAAGQAKQVRSRLDLGGMFITRSQAKQHEVHVFQNGNEYVIYINANPAVADAINGTNVKNTPEGLQTLANATRQMAANFTTRNPVFVLSNFSRDYIYSSSILGVKEDAAYAMQFQKNMLASASALQRYILGKADLSKEQDRYLSEYIMNGAKTGFSHMLELQQVQRQIERDIRRGQRKTPYDRSLGPVLNALEAMNDMAENMSRLSVYITSREQGRSIAQSVSDAKEVTVNFNRRGAGGYGAEWVRPLYLFVNAAIQALANFAKVAAKNPGKAAVLVSSYALTGFIMPYIAMMLGGDDGYEDYMKLGDWERQNNLCIYTGNGFIKIPLPQELRVFHRMGDNVFQSAFGGKDKLEALSDITLGFADLIPSNPLGAIDGSWADIMPDGVKPLFQLAANRTFSGSMIKNQWADKNKPGYLKVRTNKKGDPYAPAWIIKLAEGLDDASGGDGVQKGLISLNPDVINHLMRGYFGGLYTMASQGIDIANKTIDITETGEFNLKVRETPLRTFFTDSDDLQVSGSGLQSRYFSVVDEVQEILRQTKGYQEQVRNGEIGLVEFGQRIQGLDVQKAKAVNEIIRRIKRYEGQLKDLDDEQQKNLERDIANLKGRAIELYSE